MSKLLPENFKEIIKNSGVMSLPDNPSAKGFNAKEIKTAIQRCINILASYLEIIDNNQAYGFTALKVVTSIPEDLTDYDEGTVFLVLGESKISLKILNDESAVTIVDDIDALEDRLLDLESCFDSGKAKKAIADGDGNTISTTYLKKSEVVNSDSSTSTSQPVSAYQVKLLKDAVTAIQTLLQSNDSDLDTLQEIVTYIKSNKSLIEAITTSKVSVTDIVDNLTSEVSNKPLSAKQGYALGQRVTALENADSFVGENYYTKTETNALLANKQNALTFDIEPTENSTNPVTSGGVYNAVKVVTEVANGRCKAYIMDAEITIASLKSTLSAMGNTTQVYDAKGNPIRDAVIDGEYDEALLATDAFAQNDYKTVSLMSYASRYLILSDYLKDPMKVSYILDTINNYRSLLFKAGDVIIIKQTEVPDWWYMGGFDFSIMETQKVDLAAYYTKLQADALLANKLALSFAGASPYDATATYPLGATCTHDGKLYKCTTAIQVAEAWDATHWTEVTLNDYVDLGSAQTIRGTKTINDTLIISNGTAKLTLKNNGWTSTIAQEGGMGLNLTGAGLVPTNTSTKSLGSSGYKWKDLYLAGTAYANSIELDNDGYLKCNGTNVLQFSSYTMKTYGFYPLASNAYDIGLSVRLYKDLYLGGVISDGTNSASVAEIMSQFNPTDAGMTEIKWSKFLSFSLSTDATLTLETAKAGCLPEYKAKITNSHATDPIDITLPSGTAIVTNDDNIAISSNVMTLPAQTTVELNIQDGHAIAYNWSAQ